MLIGLTPKLFSSINPSSTRIFKNPDDFACHQKAPLYFRSEYLKLQDYDHIVITKAGDHIFSIFEIQGKEAVSLPGSPFGSFYLSREIDEKLLIDFHRSTIEELKRLGVFKVQITHPPSFYDGFIPIQVFRKLGYMTLFEDHNQWIDLKKPIRYHKMETRKLGKLRDGCLIREMRHEEIPDFYEYIRKAREEKGLKINLSLNLFQSLVETFPSNYDGWIIERNGKVISEVLMVKVTSEIVYYFLPATCIEDKQYSPMTTLIDHVIHHYQDRNFKYLDMGVSSIGGVKQESLFDYKERMGASSTPKLTMSLEI